MKIEVSNERVEISKFNERTFRSDNFHNVRDSSSQIILDVTFTDGSMIKNVFSSNYFDISQYISIISDSESIEIDNENFILRDDSFRTVKIIITSSCGNENENSFTPLVYDSYINPNLKPQVFDFDIQLIENSNLQFGNQNFNDEFILQFSINMNENPLITYSLKIWYDETQFIVQSCSKAGKTVVFFFKFFVYPNASIYEIFFFYKLSFLVGKKI